MNGHQQGCGCQACIQGYAEQMGAQGLMDAIQLQQQRAQAYFGSAQAQAQQLGQLDEMGRRQQRPQYAEIQHEGRIRCCLCDGRIVNTANGVLRCTKCNEAHKLRPESLEKAIAQPRDRDGMLLADRLQVLADENVTLLAENARLRRRVEELERKR